MKQKLLSIILVFSVLFGEVLALPLTVFAEGANPPEDMQEIEPVMSAHFNFGGSGSDYYHAVTAVEGGYVAAGYSAKASFGNGDWSDESKGGFNAVIVRYDTAGKILWKKNFGGRGGDSYDAVTAVEDGYIAVGSSDILSFGNEDWSGVKGKGERDAIIVKYDTAGNVLWKKNFGGSGSDYYHAVVAAEGGCVAVGKSQEASFGSGDWTEEKGIGKDDAVIVKYDTNGNVLWKKPAGGNSFDEYESVTAAQDGYVAVGGFPKDGQKDAVIVKYATDGEVLWEKSFGGSSSDQFSAVTAVQDGYVAVGNSSDSSFGSGDWKGITKKGGYYDAIIVKYDTAGNVLWKKNFGGNDWDEYGAVAAEQDGYVAVGRSYEDSFGNGDWRGKKGKGGIDAIIVKYNTAGNVLWKKNFGGNGWDQYDAVAVVEDSYVAAGYSKEESFGNGDWSGVTGKGDHDAAIVKYKKTFGKVPVDIPPENTPINNMPTGIKLGSKTLTLKKGSSTKLTYTLQPANASSAVNFTTSNPSVATVDRNGTVTAVKKGTATITANASGVKATCKVTVTEEVKLKTPSLTVKLDSANGVKLSWKKVSGAQGYYIYRSTSKNSGYKQIKKLKGTSYVNNKLKSGKTYYYKVAAYKGSTLSAKSKVKSKKIIGNLKTPKLRISADKEHFTISWNSLKGADKIEIFRETRNGGFKKWKIVPAKNKKVSYSCNSLKKGVEYHFALRAYYSKDRKKINSELSNAVTFKR